MMMKMEKSKSKLETFLTENFGNKVGKVTVEPCYAWDEKPKYLLEIHFRRALTEIERNFLPVESQGIKVVGSFPSHKGADGRLWKNVFAGTAGLKI